ncbi:MAG: proton-conducting membrane transporter [Defluviitaleaceae bacterium]|nr:proton-conducting membrane transporter [Defluviitaleaceae bacterium]
MLPYLVIAPVLIAAFLYVASTHNAARILAVVFQAGLFMASAYLVWITRNTEITTFIGSYNDLLSITLRADSISADFVFITTAIFLVISIYSYQEKKDVPLVWFLLFILESSLIGLFLAGDLFSIFVLVEVSTIATLVLVMYDRVKRKMYYGIVFLMVNIVAAQFYLFGLGYIYMVTGALDIRQVTAIVATSDPQNLILPYALIMTSIGFKCTLIPFFSWAPKVKIYPEAPTVVQAILSGLQIKSAVFLFLQFQEIFQPIAPTEFFLVIGIISALFGAFMAICQTDIRMILAYHTVSQVGLIIVGISLGGYSYIGGLYHIFSHAVFKTTLFLATGMIIRSYNTANVYKIHGVLKRMPFAGAATVAAVLGIVGAPFFIGSVSKYFIAYDISPMMNIITIIIGLGTIISFVKFSSIFFGKPDLVGDMPIPEKCKTAPTVFLGAVCLAGGIFGTQAIQFLFGYQVEIVMVSYIQKSIIFLVSLGVGYLIYRYVIKGNHLLKRIGGIYFGFRTVCFAMGVFFAILLAFTAW